MKIIGFGHYSRTGKDTTANAIARDLSTLEGVFLVKKLPFAWKLKQVAYELYSWDGMQPPEFYETPEGEKFRDVPLPTVGKTPVEIWIALGTPAVREQVYDRTWIDYALRTNHRADLLIIPDVRFPNEVAAIKERGGTVIKVVRPGYGPRKSVADRALLNFNGWDYVIGKSGSVSELEDWARQFASWAADLGPKPYQSDADRQEALSVEKIEPWDQPKPVLVPSPTTWLPLGQDPSTASAGP